MSNRETLAGLQPAEVWAAFADISDIPRGSGNETAVMAHIRRKAESFGLRTESDSTGNLLVSIPANGGRSEGTIIQGHVDMVCEKNSDMVHDFLKDPIRIVKDGAVVRADRTTLGADNGIAVAMMLALMESSAPHGPLDLVFTVDEETGLSGARALDAKLLRQKRLINIDSEDEGLFYIGCAGGMETEGTIPLRFESVPVGWDAATIAITGLQGGHSGVEIHQQKGNALKLAGRVLKAVQDEIRIAELSGGDKHNAIPREAFAKVAFDPARKIGIGTLIAKWETILRDEFGKDEPGLAVRFEPLEQAPQKALAATSQKAVLEFLSICPHGVLAMSRAIPGLVSTSTNLARLRFENGEMKVLTSQRSDIQSMIAWSAETVSDAFRACGGSARSSGEYPAWKPSTESELLNLSMKTYAALYPGTNPKPAAIHAGLECGVIGAKMPGMDMVSFGPNIRGAHTPHEEVEIAGVERIWKLLLAILAA